MENNTLTISGSKSVRHTVDAFEVLSDAIEAGQVAPELDAATFDSGGNALVTVQFDGYELRKLAVDRFYDNLPAEFDYQTLNADVAFNYSEDVFEFTAEQDTEFDVDGDVLLAIARAAIRHLEPYSDLSGQAKRLVDELVEGGYDE